MQEQSNNTFPETDVPHRKKLSKKTTIAIAVAAVLLLVLGIVLGVHFAKNTKPTQTPAPGVPETTGEVTDNYPAEPAKVLPKYREAYTQNNDLVGWITVPNTAIDFPVVQGDDNKFYLRRDFNKEYLREGSIFMDYRNHIDTFDRNTILYGHNYSNSVMFSDLEKYKDIEFYKTAPVIQFDTIHGEYSWKVFAVFITDADQDKDGYIFNYIYPFMTEESLGEFVGELHKRSLYHPDVEVLPTDKVLALSTCSYDLDSPDDLKNVRLVVMARLVRDGESTDVNVENAVINENPKYPQLYYDKHNKKNPYKNDAKWYPRGEN